MESGIDIWEAINKSNSEQISGIICLSYEGKHILFSDEMLKDRFS